MIERRPFSSLEQARRSWLDARHHFSAADRQHPERARWGALCAWNDETIAPGAGFAPRLHTDMDIITCVQEGILMHEDDLGNRSKTGTDDVQVMSAGSGLTYAELNTADAPARVFQIWMEPQRRGAPPSWGRKSFPQDTRRGGFVALASGIDGDDDALPLRSDARLSAVTLKAGEATTYRFAHARRRGYIVASSGRLRVNDVELDTGDGAAISDETDVLVTALGDAQALLADTRA